MHVCIYISCVCVCVAGSKESLYCCIPRESGLQTKRYLNTGEYQCLTDEVPLYRGGNTTNGCAIRV